MAKLDPKRQISLLFPQLKYSEFESRSPDTPEYNCIAWAAGLNDEWLDPTPGYSWPDGLPRNYSIQTFTMLFQKFGYALCENGSVEQGYEKVALYGKSGLCKHAARQLPNGLWTSKLGKLEDIEHKRPEGLAGLRYGKVVFFLRRPRTK